MDGEEEEQEEGDLVTDGLEEHVRLYTPVE